MSKRPSSSEGHHEHKRQRQTSSYSVQEALAELSKHAEGIADCLQTLKEHQEALRSIDSQNPEVAHIENQISQLRSTLVPALQSSTPNQNYGAVEARSSTQVPSVPVPELVKVTPWVVSEISHQLPPLPKILKPELEAAAFTHPGLGHGGPSYERLEWLGDAYIEMISTILIDQTFTRIAAGRCSQLREQIVRNVTLADYFRQYNMPARAKLPVDFGNERGAGRGRSKDKDLIKTQADMFEAYVAATILSDPDGLVKTTAWLKALWGRTLIDEIKQFERPQLLPPPSKVIMQPNEQPVAVVLPKERLGQCIGTKGIRIRYADIPCSKRDKLNNQLFSVGVYLNGWGETDKLLGVGTALKKTEAGQKAAALALENKKLMKFYEEKKMAFLKAQAEQGAVALRSETG